jgi:hypothetical protein
MANPNDPKKPSAPPPKAAPAKAPPPKAPPATAASKPSAGKPAPGKGQFTVGLRDTTTQKQHQLIPDCVLRWGNYEFAYNLEWMIVPDSEPEKQLKENHKKMLDKSKVYCLRSPGPHRDFPTQIGVAFDACGHKAGQIAFTAAIAGVYPGSWAGMMYMNGHYLVVVVRDATVTPHGDSAYRTKQEAVARLEEEHKAGGLNFLGSDPACFMDVKSLGTRVHSIDVKDVLMKIKSKPHLKIRLTRMKTWLDYLIRAGIMVLVLLVLYAFLPTFKMIYNKNFAPIIEKVLAKPPPPPEEPPPPENPPE